MAQKGRKSRPKLLCVDDHEGVIAGMRITLRRQFAVLTATDGAEALRRLAEEDGVAVIITDMRMPNMNGVEVLRRARQIAPRARRLLLTGYADADSAIAAVNEGAVFRYLTKPCSPPDLRAACERALEEYELESEQLRQEAERVHRQIGLIADFLLLARPEAVGLGVRMTRLCQGMGAHLALPLLSELTSAAKLFPLGRAVVSAAELETYYASDGESASHGSHANAQLLSVLAMVQQIHGAAQIVELLRLAAEPSVHHSDVGDSGTPDLILAAKILRASAVIAELESLGSTTAEAVGQAWAKDEVLASQLTRSVVEAIPHTFASASLVIPLSQLRVGMVVSKDLETKQGQLLVAAGTVIRHQVLTRIQSLAGPQLPPSIAIETTGGLTASDSS